MREPDCVGAFIRDPANRVFVQRRTLQRRLLPGTWDIVGGHIETGESVQVALERELHEETGWKLRRVEAQITDWEWEWGGRTRREVDFLVEVDGDLSDPVLEEGKQDLYAWVGRHDLELMMEGRTDGDRRLRDLVAKATRIRLTERLRLEPIGPEHAQDLCQLHQDDGIAHWYAGTWSPDEARRNAEKMAADWEGRGVSKWIAYERGSGELIGRGGLSRIHLDGADRVEVGWAVRGEFRGRGYAGEIGRAGLAFAFDDLGAGQVISFTERHNARSRAVMERLGMTYAREIRLPGLIEGRDGVHDAAPFALYTVDRP